MEYPEPPELISSAALDGNVLSNTLALFDLSSGLFPFTSKRISKILERRTQLQGELFVDYMLKQAGIARPEKVFPPKDKSEFNILVEEILTSEWGISNSQTTEDVEPINLAGQDVTAGIKRSCLIYYLLAWWGDQRHITYGAEQRISGQFAELTHAYFLLDVGSAAQATSLLCTPLITPSTDTSAKIFHALSIATDADPNVLILRYARMAKPQLAPEDVLFLYFAALARINFVEAWLRQREYEGDLRNDVLTKIFDAILNPRPLKTSLHLLSSLPIHPFEAKFLTTYTLSPPPEIPEPSLAALQSLIILRLTHEGEYAAAVKMNREYTQYAEKLLNSEGAKSADTSKHSLKGRKEKTQPVPHAHDSMERSRPGVLLAQKQEEWRETLRESVALLPLEHRRVLEGQLHEGSMALTSFGSVAPPTAMITAAGDTSGNAGALLDMSWESVPALPEGQGALQSTPPRTMSAANKAISPMPPPATPAQNARQPSSSPHPASPAKKTSRTSLTKSAGSTMAPVETNTLGRVLKPPTPKRTGLMSYLTPLRTPMSTPNNSYRDGDGVDSLADRSMAPPPSTGRLINKNPFFDPSLRTVQNLILEGKTPSADKEGDVEMRDGDETEDAEEEIIGDTEGEGDSFVIAPRKSNTSNLYPNLGGVASLGGGLLSAASIIQIKKTQEREREREQQETERAERERVDKERKQAELVERRARLEAVRRSLGGDNSFGSTSGMDVAGGPVHGKRKRDKDDLMTREDEEMLNASDKDTDDAGMATGRGRRKVDGGAALVRKPLVTSAPVPMSTKSVTSAGRSSRSGALVPPTSVAPSISVTTAPAPANQEESAQTNPRRSSRISNTSGSVGGSQAGSNRGPSPSPDPTEDGEETADEDGDGDMSMPGAYVLDEEESNATGGKARRSGRKPASASKPVSKSKSKKPTSTGSTTTTAIRKTRSSKAVGVPEPIAEDTANEEPAPSSPTKGRGKGKAKALSSGVGYASIRVPVPESAIHREEISSPVDEGGVRRSSRRLTALATGGAGSGTESTGTGRRSGRKV